MVFIELTNTCNEKVLVNKKAITSVTDVSTREGGSLPHKTVVCTTDGHIPLHIKEPYASVKKLLVSDDDCFV